MNSQREVRILGMRMINLEPAYTNNYTVVSIHSSRPYPNQVNTNGGLLLYLYTDHCGFTRMTKQSNSTTRRGRKCARLANGMARYRQPISQILCLV